MKGRSRRLAVVAALLLAFWAVPCGAAVNVVPFEQVLEGLGPHLTFQAQSYPLPSGSESIDGLGTLDTRRDTVGRVYTDVWNDARGRVSGVAMIVVFKDGDPVMEREVPVKGRSRVVMQERAKLSAVDLPVRQVPPAIQLDGVETFAINLAMNGRGVDTDARQPFAFNLTGLQREREFFSYIFVPGDGEIERRADKGTVVGRLNITVPRQHVGRSNIELSGLGPARAEWFIVLDDELLFDPQRGIFRSNAAVESESLGILTGGKVRAKANWYRPGSPRPGTFVTNAVLPPFRYSVGGFILVTREQAMEPEADMGELLDAGIATRELTSCPGALTNTIVTIPPSLVIQMGELPR